MILEEQYIQKNLQETEKYKAEFNDKLQKKQNQILLKDNELKNLKITQQKNQTMIWIAITVVCLLLLFLIAVLLIIQIKNRNRFKTLALNDHLTDAPNRRAILDLAKCKFEEAKSSNKPFSIAIIDLDFFKRFNDQFGHDTGDDVLKAFSQSCKETLRKEDHFGRYGGEEWLITFNGADCEQVKTIFVRLRDCLNIKNIKALPEDHLITFSMGVSQYDADIDKCLESMISRADEKLYSAKEDGRNRVVF